MTGQVGEHHHEVFVRCWLWRRSHLAVPVDVGDVWPVPRVELGNCDRLEHRPRDGFLDQKLLREHAVPLAFKPDLHGVGRMCLDLHETFVHAKVLFPFRARAVNLAPDRRIEAALVVVVDHVSTGQSVRSRVGRPDVERVLVLVCPVRSGRLGVSWMCSVSHVVGPVDILDVGGIHPVPVVLVVWVEWKV